MHNIVLFATDDAGGAGKAALRLVKALNQSGHNCRMLVKNKSGNDNNVIKIQAITKFPFKERILTWLDNRRMNGILLDSKYYFGNKYDDINPTDIDNFIDFTPNIVIVTWITWFVSPKTINLFAARHGASIVICPMDMSPFTGGCHYAWDCKGFESNCGNCPAILDSAHKYVPVEILKEKKNYWPDNITKYWSFSSGIKSELLRASITKNKLVEEIFLPIDEKIFNANNRIGAKKIFGINPSDKVILFGSSFSYEKRKGINYFLESLEVLHTMLLANQSQDIKIIIAGRKDLEKSTNQLPFEVIDIDFIKDDLLLAQLYQAADVLVCPSIQDSGPMMINEAQMCGLPVIAFNIGVAPDFIINDFSGYICKIGDAKQMALNIKKVLYKETCTDNYKISELAYSKTSFNAFESLVRF